MRIGTWTVLETWKNHRSNLWGLCKCDCGFTAPRSIDSLRRHSKKYPTRCRACYKKEDIKPVLGKTFGTRTVIEDFFEDCNGTKNAHFAKCKCICGDISIIRATFLIQGKCKKCNECRIRDHLKKGTFDPNMESK
jgi:hypothetical protein